jgi:hypothetical protein
MIDLEQDSVILLYVIAIFKKMIVITIRLFTESVFAKGEIFSLDFFLNRHFEPVF